MKTAHAIRRVFKAGLLRSKFHMVAAPLGMFAITSCSLQEEPYGFFSEDNFYNTEADAEAAVNYAYETLTFLEYSRTVFYLGDAPTNDIAVKRDESADNVAFDDWDVATFKNNIQLENFFRYAFIGINRANAVIEKVPSSDIDPAKRNQFVGEAYFLRAWSYFNLVRNFGRVPYHTTVVASLGQTSTPLASSVNQIYELILSDCKTAAGLMPANAAPRLGRVDRVAAQALAAKAYLYMASAKESGVTLYNDIPAPVAALYDSAAHYASLVVDAQSVYKFDDNLLDIYDVEKPRGPEHIFLMSMDRTGAAEGQYSKISKMFIPWVDGATLYLDNQDGSFSRTHDGWQVLQTTTDLYGAMDNADKRKTLLIVDKVYNDKGEEIASYPGNKLPYPFTRKYIDPKFIGDKTSTRPFLIRYSDIALTYAEAAGPTARSYELVNYIRNRAGLGNLQAGLDPASFRTAVLRERRFELAFEGNRMYDIRRTNRINKDVKAAANLTEAQTTFYPIPQNEINLNGSLR